MAPFNGFSKRGRDCQAAGVFPALPVLRRECEALWRLRLPDRAQTTELGEGIGEMRCRTICGWRGLSRKSRCAGARTSFPDAAANRLIFGWIYAGLISEAVWPLCRLHVGPQPR